MLTSPFSGFKHHLPVVSFLAIIFQGGNMGAFVRPFDGFPVANFGSFPKHLDRWSFPYRDRSSEM